MTPIKILILEDDPGDAELVTLALRQAEIEATVVYAVDEMSFEAVLERHQQDPLDLIISDYMLPRFDASRVLQRVASLGLDLPVIVVTGAMGEDVVADVMRRGAADYLIKDRLMRLGQAVRHAFDQRRLRDKQRRAEASLKLLAGVSVAATETRKTHGRSSKPCSNATAPK